MRGGFIGALGGMAGGSASPSREAGDPPLLRRGGFGIKGGQRGGRGSTVERYPVSTTPPSGCPLAEGGRSGGFLLRDERRDLEARRPVAGALRTKRCWKSGPPSSAEDERSESGPSSPSSSSAGWGLAGIHAKTMPGRRWWQRQGQPEGQNAGSSTPFCSTAHGADGWASSRGAAGRKGERGDRLRAVPERRRITPQERAGGNRCSFEEGHQLTRTGSELGHRDGESSERKLTVQPYASLLRSKPYRVQLERLPA